MKKWANRLFPLFWWAMWVNRSGRSPKMSDVSESLRSLTKNERPWAIRSGRSEEMSNREQIAQVSHQKWTNEWIARFFELIAHSLIFGQKTSDSLGKPMSKFPALFATGKSRISKFTKKYQITLPYYSVHDCIKLSPACFGLPFIASRSSLPGCSEEMPLLWSVTALSFSSLFASSRWPLLARGM